MTDARRDRARFVALVLAAVDVLFIGFGVLSGTSEPEAVVVAVVNLVLATAIVVLLRGPRSGRRDSNRQVF